jgi:hypothetical protein
LLQLARLAVLPFYLLINGIEIEALPSERRTVGITFPVGNQLRDEDVFARRLTTRSPKVLDTMACCHTAHSPEVVRVLP